MKKALSLTCLIASSLIYADAMPPPDDDSDLDLFSKNNSVIFVSGEFLYWKVNEAPLDYAIKMKQPAWGPTNVYANGKMEKASFDWEPGFRVNVGWFDGPSYWDAYLQYTYLRSHGHNETHAPDESNLFLNGTWPHPDPSITSPSLSKAESDIHFHYNVGDFLFSRRFFPNPHLRLKLFGGATGAWLNQDWKVEYTDTNNQKSHIRNHWRFSGGGLRIGLGVDWYLHITGLYFTGIASGALLGGEYHNVSKQTTSTTPSFTILPADQYDTSVPIRNNHFEDARFAAQAQIAAGPSWQQSFDIVRTELFIGYELTSWANLQEVYRSTSGIPQASKETWMGSGLITLQGLTARFTLDF
jgi:hypothetical protein